MATSEILNKLPGLEKIGGAVDTKTAAYAAWNSITSLLNLPSDPSKWYEKKVGSHTYQVPKGFTVSIGNQSTDTQVVGSDRDTYLKHLTSNLDAGGNYGFFSGTLKASFDMTEDTTEAYSFGTYTFEQQLYSLTLPEDITEFLDPTFVSDLNGTNMSPNAFYKKYGTHYTSSIIMGGKASLSLYSQFQSQYSSETFKTDLSAAYNGLVASFKTNESYSHTSSQSKETYKSSSSLVLVGGDTTQNTMDGWKATIDKSPAFINFNTQVADLGIVPLYELCKPGDRKEKLKTALPDYLNPPLGVQIFCAASTKTEYPTATVAVPENYKVLSGGAKVHYYGAGELLTSSYPVSNNQWTASSTDMDYPDQAILTVFAVAVYDPRNWLDVKVFSQKSESLPHPSAKVSVGHGYTLTGGGAHIGSGGNYLTASYPYLTPPKTSSNTPPKTSSNTPPKTSSNTPPKTSSNTSPNISSNTWLAASTDLVHPCSATITAYAIGVKWSISAPKTITNNIAHLTSPSEAYPQGEVSAPNGTKMVGGGALDNYRSGPGNILYASYPSDANTWSANGKDHEIKCSSMITVYAIGVNNMVIPDDKKDG